MSSGSRSASANPKKRKRSSTSATPGSKLRRTSSTAIPDEGTFDKATRLAIDHMIHDDTTHPLYQRNLDQVLDAVRDSASRRGECGPFPESLNTALSLFRGDETKVKSAHQTLLTTWTRKTLRELAAGLEETRFPLLSKDGGNLKVEDVGERYKCELNISPLINLDEDESEAPKKRRKGKGKGQGQGKGKLKANASGEGVSKDGASRSANSQQYATPQDSNEESSSEDEESGEEGSEDSGESGKDDEGDEGSQESSSESERDSESE